MGASTAVCQGSSGQTLVAGVDHGWFDALPWSQQGVRRRAHVSSVVVLGAFRLFSNAARTYNSTA